MSTLPSRNGASLTALCLTMGLSGTSLGEPRGVVRYTKAELAEGSRPDFIRARNLGDFLVGKIVMLAVALTGRQSGGNTAVRDAVGVARKTDAQYRRGLGTLTVDPNSFGVGGDVDKLRMVLSQQIRKTSEVQFKGAFPLFERVRRGLTLNLDASHGGHTDAVSFETRSPRYGLVATDIIPNDSQISIASLDTIKELNQGYARPAKVVYVVGKLDADRGEDKVFNQQDLTSNPEMGLVTPPEAGMWNRKPSTELDLTMDVVDPRAAASDSLGGAKVPGALVTLTQRDGFISVQAVTTDLHKSRSVTLKAPLYGRMSISRKMDGRSRAIETTAMNLLGDSGLPAVNVVYLHDEKKARGEMVVKDHGVHYTLTLEPRAGWASDSDYKMRRVGDKISAGVETSF